MHAFVLIFFFSSRRRHTRFDCDWSSDVCSSDLRAEMPFLDHLEELRWRILWSLLAIVLATVAGWFLVERADIIGLLIRPIKPLLPDGKLKFTHPTEPFFITLKFAFVLGLVLSSPVVIYQAWAFLAPALYPREKRLIVPALSAGVVLFLGGATIAYLWVLPRALRVLFAFQQNVFDPIITAEGYFGFAAQIMIGFGVVTELPLVVVILAALGLVTPQLLARNRRYAIALSAVAAALLTPPDAVSMLIMMVPLLLLYEVSIVCAWIVTKRRGRRGAGARAAGLPPPPARGRNPPLRDRVVGRGRGAAHAPRCGVDADHDGAATAAVRGEHRLRLDRHQAAGAARAGRERRGPRPAAARCADGTGGSPGRAATTRHRACPRRLGCAGALARHRHPASARD